MAHILQFVAASFDPRLAHALVFKAAVAFCRNPSERESINESTVGGIAGHGPGLGGRVHACPVGGTGRQAVEPGSVTFPLSLVLGSAPKHARPEQACQARVTAHAIPCACVPPSSMYRAIVTARARQPRTLHCAEYPQASNSISAAIS